MSFTGIQNTFSYQQTNNASREKIFPLLCPVREADWIDGWKYRMIYSKSGLIEKDCVFATPNEDGSETIWQVTQYDTKDFKIEFVRFSQGENIVRINICLEKLNDNSTRAIIEYKYTGLNNDQNKIIKEELKDSFIQSMLWWEKAINYYLQTGEILKRS